MKNYYDLLGIERNSSDDQIKSAYRKLSMKFHPDKNSGEAFFSDIFRQINEAYQVLSEPITKRNYDAKLSEFENSEKNSQKAYSDAQNKLQEQLLREKMRLQAEAKRVLDAERQKLRDESRPVQQPEYIFVEKPTVVVTKSKADNLRESLGWWRGCRNVLLIANLILGFVLFTTKSQSDSREGSFNARVNSRNGLRLRQTPSATAETVSKIPYCEIVKVLRTNGPSEVFRNTSKNWYFIEYKGKKGWIWGGYLTKQPS